MTQPNIPPPKSTLLNQVIATLEERGATVVVPADRNEQVLYVNHTKVLVRFQHTPNTHVPIELMHEVPGNKWVRSWGLRSDADSLLYVDVNTGTHNWFHLPSLRAIVTKYLVQDKVQMMNNSQATRLENGVSSNVMNVWIRPSDDADYISTTPSTEPSRREYTDYLEQFIGRER
jgi:prolyl-tRNA synthetase